MKNLKFKSLGPLIVLLLLFISAQVNRIGAEEHNLLLSEIKGLKEVLVIQPQGILKYPYIIPSNPLGPEGKPRAVPGEDVYGKRDEEGIPLGVYCQLFDWDSFFVGVAFTYDKKAEYLKNSVMNFLHFADANGYIPRTISPERFYYTPEQCKPFLAQGAYIASKFVGDFRWLKNGWYKKLVRFLQYWESYRCGEHLLFKWMNAVESGVDNHPALLGLKDNIVEAVDINTYIYREYLAMALLAKHLGKKQDETVYKEKARNLKKQMNLHMWDNEEKMYFNIDTATARKDNKIRIKSWTNLTPLWARIPSKEQADAMIEKHLVNPREFWSPYGLRSLAKDEPIYNNAQKDIYGNYTRTVCNWQGPIWVVSNYILMHGLLNYGYKKQALEVAEKIVHLLEQDVKNSGGMHENYDAETGEPLWAENFGSWNILAEKMIEEAKTGFDPTSLRDLK